MATTTSNLGLTKPDYTDAADVGVLNGNFDLIDQAIAEDRVSNVRYTNVHNLLDNSDFTNPVNQRGQSSYAGSDNANVYTIDRWFTSWQGGATVTVGNGYIQKNGYKLWQRINPQAVSSEKTYTGAICLQDGTLYVYSGNLADGFGTWNDILWVSWHDGEPYFRFEPSLTQPILWAALYEGEYTAETLPPYVPKGYAAELVECMRYYQTMTVLVSASTSSVQAPGRFFFSLPIEMRVNPSVSYTLFSGSTAPEAIYADKKSLDIQNMTSGYSHCFVMLNADL